VSPPSTLSRSTVRSEPSGPDLVTYPKGYEWIPTAQIHFNPTAGIRYPLEPVSANQNQPRGRSLLKQKFDLDFPIRFKSNLVKSISIDPCIQKLQIRYRWNP
jgi:hypothetical protein